MNATATRNLDALPEGVYVTTETKRKGERFCCPGCGRGCTWDEYLRAVKAAKKLIDRLGPGWVARVWDNLGWHYSAELAEARLSVSVYTHKRETTYHVLMHYEADAGGGVWHASAPTPEAAIQLTLESAQKELDTKTLGISAVRLALEKVKADRK